MSEPDCAEALRELYGYLDGELTVQRRATIRGHLEGCAHCLEAYDFEAELKLVIAKRCTEAPPQDLRSRISRVIEECTDPD